MKQLTISTRIKDLLTDELGVVTVSREVLDWIDDSVAELVKIAYEGGRRTPGGKLMAPDFGIRNCLDALPLLKRMVERARADKSEYGERIRKTNDYNEAVKILGI